MNPEEQELVSVVIPARNAASTIARLLRSLVPDRGTIREILLIDDGSTDATATVAVEIAERHGLPLRVWPVSFGAAGASRNFGIERARGKFLFFIDSDDELFPGALSLLASKLLEAPDAGLAIGACVRRTANRVDKIKVPHGYTEDRNRNIVRYLANELWPIAMGSAMLVTSEAAAIRFPESIGLDEDTCFWTALLARVRVVTTPEPVLLYRLDEVRMASRYTVSPRRTLLGISRELRKLACHGVPETALKQRAAWVALRIARQLIMERRYREAARILRLARRHPLFRGGWKVFQYTLRIRAGNLVHALCGSEPASRVGTLRSHGERRFLVVTVDPAAPPVSGADLRNFQNASSASKRGPCGLVSIRPGGSEAGCGGSGIEIHAVGLPGDRSRPLSSRRCRVEARIPRSVLPRLREVVARLQPDTILVEGIPLAALLKHLRPHAKMLVLDMHNIESDLAARTQSRSSRRTWLSRILDNDPAKTRRLEKKAIRAVDRIWVCSDRDRERLLKLHRPTIPIHVVPNGIPRAASLPIEIPTRVARGEDGPVILFVGHLGYWPNVTAAKRLAEGILPIVRETFPSASLVLAGRYPATAVQSLAENPGVELHANPSDLSTFYERAHIAAVPLSEGGGTRIKILEAMASGLPVVATPLAVEGLDLAENEEVLLAESDEGIAGHIVALHRNPDARMRQCHYAERTVRLRFGSEAIDFAVREGLAFGGY